MLKQLLDRSDYLGEHVDAFEQRIDQLMGEGEGDGDGPFAQAARRLDPVPGINRRAAQSIPAEIGHDMTRFPTAAHLPPDPQRLTRHLVERPQRLGHSVTLTPAA